MKKTIYLLLLLIFTINYNNIYSQSIPDVTKYETGKRYRTGSKVRATDGSLYIANKITSTAPPSVDWDKILEVKDYDTNSDNVVDNSATLGGQIPNYYLDLANSIGSITESKISDLGDYETKSNRLLSTATAYTTIQADVGKKNVITSNSIILDDTGLTVGFQEYFLNNSGGDITIFLASGDSSIQTLQPLTNGNYLYVELIAANTWSVVIGGNAGIKTIFEDKTPKLGGNLDPNGNSIIFPATATSFSIGDLNADNNSTSLSINDVTQTIENTSVNFTHNGNTIIDTSNGSNFYSLKPTYNANIVSAIPLDNNGGTFYTSGANLNTNFTTSNLVIGGYAKIWVNNNTSEPTVNGSSTGKIPGATWVNGNNFDLVIGTDDGVSIYYYFLQRGSSVVDNTPPTITSAIVENATPSTIDFTFSEAVTGTNLGFTIAGTTSTTFSTLTGSGTTWTGTLATPVVNGETVTFSYASATGDFADLASNALADITNQAVTNNVASTLTYGLKLTTGQTEYLQNNTFSTTAASDFEFSFRFLTMPTANAYLFGNNKAGSTNPKQVQAYYNNGNIDLRIRDDAGTSQISSAVAFSIGNVYGVKRVGTRISLMKNGVEAAFFTLTGTLSFDSELIIGNLNSSGAATTFTIDQLVIRGETFLPTSQNTGATITSPENSDTLTLNSAVSTTAMYIQL